MPSLPEAPSRPERVRPASPAAPRGPVQRRDGDRVDDRVAAQLGALIGAVTEAGDGGPLPAHRRRLSPTQLRVLELLARHGPQPPSVLAGLLARNPSALTRAAQHLLRAGLLDRVDDQLDRRRCRLRLTATGLDLVEHLATRRRKIITHVLGRLGSRERAELVRVLPTLTRMTDEARQIRDRTRLGAGPGPMTVGAARGASGPPVRAPSRPSGTRVEPRHEPTSGMTSPGRDI